jgi:hypothetical protein
MEETSLVSPTQNGHLLPTAGREAEEIAVRRPDVHVVSGQATHVTGGWIIDLVLWLASLDWLTIGAFLLTIGSFLGAVLDSYTSLCVIGATQGHIGSQAACPDVLGWDTRTFPLSVDMGWGGALLAVVRLARVIGIGSWRWWVVLGFEALTAAFTVAGNAFHGAVLDGATRDLTGTTLAVVISSLASAVPGVVAVGSGFTLSVLVSSLRPAPASGDLGHAVEDRPRQAPPKDANKHAARAGTPAPKPNRRPRRRPSATNEESAARGVPMEVIAEKAQALEGEDNLNGASLGLALGKSARTGHRYLQSYLAWKAAQPQAGEA